MGAFIMWDTNFLTFDVVTSETQTKSSFVTEHSVEKGANITDHIRPNLDVVELEVFVSNTPINDPNQVASHEVLNTPPIPQFFGLNSAVNAISSLLSPAATQFVANVLEVPGGAPNYVNQMIQALEQLRLTAQLVSVICPAWNYDNMLLTDLTVHGDPGTGTGRAMSLRFREIRTVTSSTTSAPIPAVPRAAAPKKDGAQAPQPDAQGVKESLLGRLTGLTGH